MILIHLMKFSCWRILPICNKIIRKIKIRFRFKTYYYTVDRLRFLTGPCCASEIKRANVTSYPFTPSYIQFVLIRIGMFGSGIPDVPKVGNEARL